MFTGIIQEVGVVDSLKRERSLIRLAIRAPKTAASVKRLESVSVNGVCLTVVRAGRGLLLFEVIPETQKCASLAALRAKSLVNLEPSLPLRGRFNGHVVLGHVDGVATIKKRQQLPGERVLTLAVSRDLRKYLVSKGPVTLDGVSLTVGKRLTASSFTVHLIPKTLKATTLGSYRAGQRVNIEIDYFAKLFFQGLKNRRLAVKCR